MRPFGDFRVSIVQSTVYVEPENADCDLDGAWEACHAIFGVVSLCRCRPCAKDLDAIFDTAMVYLGDDLSMAKSFKVESRRSDKRFPLTSIGLSQEIGGRLAEAFPDVTVDVHHPDYTVYVEVRDRAAYVQDVYKRQSVTMTITSAAAMASSAWRRINCSISLSVFGSMPPVSTSSNSRPFQSQSP